MVLQGKQEDKFSTPQNKERGAVSAYIQMPQLLGQSPSRFKSMSILKV